MSKYANEVGAPTMSSCSKSPFTLQFDGKHLSAHGAWANAKYKAVSGRPNEKGEFDYSAERQKLGSVGPIPEGEYWINPSDLWENNWLRNHTTAPRAAWGDFRITIRVQPGTVTHGRGGFFIHGGTTYGSAGCIDLALEMNNFIRDLKAYIQGAPNCYIGLTVKYT